jgi:hypothetical protein
MVGRSIYKTALDLQGVTKMSEAKMTETITVLQVSKYGVKVGDQWYNINQPLAPSNFLPNKMYEVSIRVSKTGKKYISEILKSDAGAAVSAPAPVAVNPDPERTQRVINAVKGPSVSDDGKRTDIQRQGLYQAALQSPGLVSWATNVDEYLAFVRQAAEAGIKFVNEK